MKRKLPARLTVELNGHYPVEACYVTDGIGTANGGFRKGFKSHDALNAWLDRHGYETVETPATPEVQA